jgi:hypothetical protein
MNYPKPCVNEENKIAAAACVLINRNGEKTRPMCGMPCAITISHTELY